MIVEPKQSSASAGTPRDASCLLSLVSYALNVSTEGPFTIINKWAVFLFLFIFFLAKYYVNILFFFVIGIYRDGASLCGVFCAVFNCIQQINMDDSVDVFTTVRQLQTRRPEFCSTQVLKLVWIHKKNMNIVLKIDFPSLKYFFHWVQEEYLLVHKTLRDYIEATKENTYANHKIPKRSLRVRWTQILT